MASKKGGTPGDHDGEPYRDAFAAVKDQIDAVPDDDIVGLNVDVPDIAAKAMTAARLVAEVREELAAEMAKVSLQAFDRLDRYARAAAHAHSLHIITSDPQSIIPALSTELRRTRDVLKADIKALINRGFLPNDVLDRLRRGRGHVGVANDVIALTLIIRTHWPAIQTKTAVDMSDVDRAAQKAEQLIFAVAQEPIQPSKIAEAKRTRRRAYTLLAKEYEEVRRLITFLRWHHGDRDLIAPSLYKGRGGRKRIRRSEDGEAAGEAAPASGERGAGAEEVAGRQDGDRLQKSAVSERD
ncbi:MAG: hypothetical protein HOW73_39105 [Polyangiaceae bacterium]|nr:hypothetical protein [Polyangiaceae bacterium]